MQLDPFECHLQAIEPELIVAHALEAALRIADPAAAIVAGRKIGAAAEAGDFRQQSVLHLELAAVLDERRHAVANELGGSEQGIELERCLRPGIAVLQVAGVAFHHRPFLGHRDLQERLPVVHGPAGIGDQPVRGAVTGMNVRVDEPWHHQLAGGVDRLVDLAAEALADVDDAIAFEYDLAVAYQRVSALLVTDQPTCSDFRAHCFGPARSTTCCDAGKVPARRPACKLARDVRHESTLTDDRVVASWLAWKELRKWPAGSPTNSTNGLLSRPRPSQSLRQDTKAGAPRLR